MAKNNEVPGNTIASQALLDRQLIKMGLHVMRLQSLLERLEEEGISTKALRIAFRNGPRGEAFGVLTASTESAEIVAFQSGDDLGGVLSGFSNRIGNGSIVWKADKYADET